MTRTLSPYEQNQLHKHGVKDIDLSSIEETPVEYLTGHAEFAGHDFFVSPDTLIPRLETEEILDIVKKLTEGLPKSTKLNLADVGTGSGCLGISVALKLSNLGFTNLNLILSDISDRALSITKKNIHLLEETTIKISVLNSNLLKNYPPDFKINLLLANLPYIPSSRISHLDPSVKNYEPHLALNGGENGTDLINLLLSELPSRLGNPFYGIFEIDNSHSLEDFDIPVNLKPTIKKDSFGHVRFLVLKAHNIDILS